MNTTKIIIAEDMPLETYGLRSIIAGVEGLEIIATVNNGRLLMHTLNNLQPDLLLLDISMPQMDGIEAAKRIRADNKSIKIVFVSGRYDVDVKKCMQLHAIDGFIFKGTINDSAFIETLQQIIRGEKVIIVPTPQRQPSYHILNTGAAARYKLTPTEIAVLQLVMQGMATKVIAKKLGKANRTIDIHRSNIIAKLGVGNMAEAVALAVSEGIK